MTGPTFDRTERTLRDAAEDGPSGEKPVDVLDVLLCGDCPTAGSLTVPLMPGTTLVLGRGPTLTTEFRETGGELRLHLPDARVSEQHATVDHGRDGWLLEDLGSTNGTFMGDRRIEKAALHDGQVFAVGRTILQVRCKQRGALLGRPHEVNGAPELQTLSPLVWRLHALLARTASAEVAVLLRGATGTGKEVAARSLHQLSGRRGRFVAINCGALPENLIESELFGYKRGAFSGATQDRAGVMIAAADGTLFLDEVGDLPLSAQVKLLRVLQDRQVSPLGTPQGESAAVNFRLVSATNASLDELVAAGRFRADLLARLRGLDLELPPLKERRMDLGSLVAALLSRHGGERAHLIRFDRASAESLATYDYPFNVRELEQTLQALVALAGDDHLVHHESLRETPVGRGIAKAQAKAEAKTAAATTAAKTAEPAPAAAPAAADPAETRRDLEASLSRHHGNISAVARELRCTRMQVHRWLKRWSIDLGRYRPGS